jgi:hypothetical protein
MRDIRAGATVLIVLLSLSCASANKLSQRSERDLAAGDLSGAYENARRAIAKSPTNPRARLAFNAAATILVDDREVRILSIADVDTLAAAERTLELAELRLEIARHGLPLPPDTAFARHERAILDGAAAYRYAAGERALTDRLPKVAWAEFRSAQRLVANYRDVGRRIEAAHAQALARVAIMPFADQAGVPGLSRALAGRVYAEVARHVRPEEFVFTRLIDESQVYPRITYAELDRLSRADAIRIGRRLGADQVVSGRVYGLRTSTNTTAVHQIIFRRVVERDTSGARRERYVEHDFHAVERERIVTVQYDLEVVETENEITLSSYNDTVEGYARVVFSDFQATGDCDDYRVVPPGLKRSDPARAERLESEWRRHFGTWPLPALLEKARGDRHRSRYSASDRHAFFGDCRERPVWLGGLPGENDMASIALDVVWQPVLGMLKELDAK